MLLASKLIGSGQSWVTISVGPSVCTDVGLPCSNAYGVSTVKIPTNEFVVHWSILLKKWALSTINHNNLYPFSHSVHVCLTKLCVVHVQFRFWDVGFCQKSVSLIGWIVLSFIALLTWSIADYLWSHLDTRTFLDLVHSLTHLSYVGGVRAMLIPLPDCIYCP